ncbi:Asp23/Gls24 family envelope stress response protein [Caviibacter abscessus]|uniref:hypothetical protein n=1 Tax=Caviibacter abscessus TaxID=1766719 RepID=UPI00082B026F|nr:hypothetical protein [Caviibacter abscessus]
MFLVILYIINIMLIIGLLSTLYFIVVNPILVSTILTKLAIFSNEKLGQIIIFVSIVTYISLLVLSLLEKLFKKPGSIKVRNENGFVEITMNTVETLSKNFLENKEIIRYAKLKVYSGFGSVNIIAVLECYTVEDLNEKLGKIKEDLGEYVQKMTGIKPNRINLKVSKINPEKVIETTNISNTEVIGEDITVDSVIL